MNPASAPADPLAALKPIHLPPAPDAWPPAPGWILLTLAALLGIGLLVWWLRRRHERKAPFRQAMQHLYEIEQITPAVQQFTALNQLLRRAARQAQGQTQAALPPQAWAEFLRAHAPVELQEANWAELALASYRPTPPEKTGEFIAMTRAWLRQNLPC